MIRSLNTDGVQYYKPSIYRLPGEWILIKCAYGGGISLAFKPRGSKFKKDLPVDHTKIKLIAWNIYNVTNLTSGDTGEYVCTMVFKGKIGQVDRIEITRQDLIVLKKGNKYVIGFLVNYQGVLVKWFLL